MTISSNPVSGFYDAGPSIDPFFHRCAEAAGGTWALPQAVGFPDLDEIVYGRGVHYDIDFFHDDTGDAVQQERQVRTIVSAWKAYFMTFSAAIVNAAASDALGTPLVHAFHGREATDIGGSASSNNELLIKGDTGVLPPFPPFDQGTHVSVPHMETSFYFLGLRDALRELSRNPLYVFPTYTVSFYEWQTDSYIPKDLNLPQAVELWTDYFTHWAQFQIAPNLIDGLCHDDVTFCVGQPTYSVNYILDYACLEVGVFEIEPGTPLGNKLFALESFAANNTTTTEAQLIAHWHPFINQMVRDARQAWGSDDVHWGKVANTYSELADNQPDPVYGLERVYKTDNVNYEYIPGQLDPRFYVQSTVGWPYFSVIGGSAVIDITMAIVHSLTVAQMLIDTKHEYTDPLVFMQVERVIYEADRYAETLRALYPAYDPDNILLGPMGGSIPSGAPSKPPRDEFGKRIKIIRTRTEAIVTQTTEIDARNYWIAGVCLRTDEWSTDDFAREDFVQKQRELRDSILEQIKHINTVIFESQQGRAPTDEELDVMWTGEFSTGKPLPKAELARLWENLEATQKRFKQFKEAGKYAGLSDNYQTVEEWMELNGKIRLKKELEAEMATYLTLSGSALTPYADYLDSLSMDIMKLAYEIAVLKENWAENSD